MNQEKQLSKQQIGGSNWAPRYPHESPVFRSIHALRSCMRTSRNVLYLSSAQRVLAQSSESQGSETSSCARAWLTV